MKECSRHRVLAPFLKNVIDPLSRNIQVGTNEEVPGYLVRCSMTSCLENSYYGDVEEEQYPWVDINRPIVVGIEVEFIGRGAVSWYDDVLQTKESETGAEVKT